MIKRGEGLSRFSVQNFLSHSGESFHEGETSSVSAVFGIKKVWIRGVGVSSLSVENFLSKSAENFRRGNPLVFQ